MRKRLIEKFTKSKEGSLGYTLTELLVVVAIIAIVAAIAIPSVIAISRALKFKRVNDHAKSIFLAAQQNLTEMRSDGGLKPLQSADGAGMITSASFPTEFKTEYVYTITGTDAFELILPAGSVDGTVRAEDIVIEYNPITGNVYAVFYCEDDDQNITSAYSSSDLPRNADGDKSRRKDMMLGYYDGSGLNSSQLEIEEVRATVEFINGEEGIVRVLVPVPDDFFGNLDEYAKAMTINLSVTGEYSMVQAASGAAEGESGETAQTPGYMFSVPIKVAGPGLGENCYVEYGNTIVVEYPIDSLVNYGSFANYSSSTYDGAKNAGGTDAKAHLTDLMDETRFTILPGENVTLEAEVKVDTEVKVEVENGILSGVNPMFEYLQPSGSGGYVLAVSNGRNLQNLNAIAPTIAKQVDSVVFTSDIYWNDTVSYYNDKYDAKTSAPGYQNAAGENPARALPYFVPIHNEDLFGTAKFIFPGEGDGGLGEIINLIIGKIEEIFFGGFYNAKVPTLTDELDAASGVKHADIQGNGHKIYNINIDSTQYTIPNVGEKGSVLNPDTDEYVETDLTGKFYATGENQIIDYCFTGLFGYVNTPIDNLHVVNPIVKGHEFTKETTVVQNYIYILGYPLPIGTSRVNLYNNPATGALIGAGGFNTLVTDCSTYIDKDAHGYNPAYFYHGDFSKTAAQNWYGVSGEGAVGGLVGYAKSHRNVTGELTNDKAVLAFSKCFAAVPVTGNMRGTNDKDFGYSNGVGAFIGNSQITNFYNCYASGDVKATGSCVYQTDIGNLIPDSLEDDLMDLFGPSGSATTFPYSGRTSQGAGGFVGSSHGTRYSNCFATGEVYATGNCAGGFVGFMSIDETFAYGNDAKVAQRTVFTDCYAVGSATNGSGRQENFSGGNGRVVFKLDTTMSYFVNDYYRLYAPYYARTKAEPKYGTNGAMYVFRDSYYLSSDPDKAMENTNECAIPASYEVLQNLICSHSTGNDGTGSTWVKARIKAIKDIVIDEDRERVWVKNESGYGGHYEYITTTYTYDTEYFIPNAPTLHDLYISEYAESYNGGNNGWEAATPATTHSYELETAGAVYPFSKLYGMDYYGDWPSEPAAAGLAYYESYVNDDNTYYYFDRKSTATTTDHLSNVVDLDGYAVLSQKSDNVSVTIGTKTQSLSAKASGAETFEAGSSVYYIFVLNKTLMDEAAKLCTNGAFYVPMTVTQAGDTYTMYFNPYIYLSQVNPVYGTKNAVQPSENDVPKTMYIRSARQFAGVSKLSNYWTANYTYIQQFNIDADSYLWDNATTDKKITSIGSAATPFNATYRSVSDSQFRIKGFQYADKAAGLFGVIGTSGSVENLTIPCTSVDLDSATVSDVAILAGRNEGTISNVDLSITGNVLMKGKTNAGLLAGYSRGTIQDCDVVVAQTSASVSMAATNAGGLVGCVEGTEAKKAVVTNCTVNVASKITVSGAKNAGGLIGQAKYLDLTGTEPLITMNTLTAADAAYAGGLAGWMEASEVKITDAEKAVTVTFNTVSAEKGTAAGFLGGGKNVAANGVDVTAGTVSGNIAAGFLGTGTNVDAEYCDVVITNKITGTEKAAGVAGTIGAQSVFGYVPVTLNNVTISASSGNAAGYAVEIAKEANVVNSKVTLGVQGGTATIRASGNAAGFACTVAGYVGNSTGSTMLSSVVGKGAISGANAAGFACDITGQVAGAFVTPALTATQKAYQGNSNNNLTVTGTTSAAGFALTVDKDATVTNCYVLNSIVAKAAGAKLTGFVQTNKGTITGCMANVTIAGGNAFVATNDGTVTRCYGWYGDGKADTVNTTAEIEGGGKVYSAYFVDLDIPDLYGVVENAPASVVLYGADGKLSDKIKSTSALRTQGINALTSDNTNYTWIANSAADEFPYSDSLKDKQYEYPMLRAHYGDWVVAPSFAYGVAYYETYKDGSIKVRIDDRSNHTETIEEKSLDACVQIATGKDEEGKNTLIVTPEAKFDASGEITKAGYAIFSRTGDQNSVFKELTVGDTAMTTIPKDVLNTQYKGAYSFYELTGNTLLTLVGENGSVAVDLRFANAIADKASDFAAYIVRTPEQLAQIGNVEASFSQTHDIVVPADNQAETAANIAANKTYAGDAPARKLTFASPANSWLGTVSGTVNNLTIEVQGNVSAPVVQTIADEGTVSLNKLIVTGNVAAGNSIFGTVSGKLTGVTETTKLPVEIGGTVSGSLINTVEGAKADVKIGDFTAATLPGSLIVEVKSGTVATGTVSVDGTVGNVFGAVGGTVTVGTEGYTGDAIKTGAVTNVFGNVTGGSVTIHGNITTGAVTQVFGTVGAPVEVKGEIKTGTVSTQVFGTVNANVITGEVTVNGTAAQVFGEVGSGTVTVNGDISVDKTTAHTGKIFNDVKNTVNVTGRISLGEIGANGQVFGAVTAPVTVSGGITTNNGAVNGQVFGAIDLGAGETVNVGGISVGNIAPGKSIIPSITGANATDSAQASSVSLGAVSTQEIGTAAQGETDAKTANIFGNINGGTVTVDSITTNGKDVNGNVFGTVGGTLKVGTNDENGTFIGGTITTGAVTGNVFGEATAAITTGDITINGNAGKVFGKVAGAETGNITVSGNAAQVFGEVSGKVTVKDQIMVTGNVTGNVFGDVKAEVSTGAIQTGNVTGNVFGAVTAKVTANGITAGTVGNVVASAGANSDVSTGAIVITSGQVIGPVSGGKVVTGAITVDSVTANSIVTSVSGGEVKLGDITINPVVTKDEEGNVIETKYADVPTLIGPVTTGTVSGAKVDLVSAKIPGGIFASVASGTVQNFNVTTTGAVNAPLVGDDLGGNLTNLTVECGSATVEGGILVKSVGQKAAVSGCTVKVTREAKIGGSNAGGLTGSNAGTLSGNTVNIGTVNTDGTVTGGLVVDSSNATVGGLVGTNGGTVSGATKVTITTLSGGKTVGGLVGSNSGSISGAEVSAAINHTGNGGVTIGGIVGEMTGGSLTNSKASGSINAPENLTNKANAIGGAIGKISAGTVGENNENTPTVVTTSVTVDAKWAGSAVTVEGVQFQNTGNGSVGTFVGSIVNGAFTNCSSTAKSSYQFMGQIAVKTNTLNAEQSIWFSNTTDKAETSAVADYVEGQPADYSGKGYTRLDGGYAYNTYDATLSNCTFVYSDENTYNQEISVDDYLYLGSEKKTDKYTTYQVSAAYIPRSDLKYSAFGDYGFSGKDKESTGFYYDVEGVKHQVYVTIERSGRIGNRKYTYTLYYGDAKTQFHKSDELSNIDTAYNGTLYEYSFPSANQESMYMIVNSGYAMDANGKAVSFKSEFEKTADANLYNAIWQSTGSNATWKNLSNDSRYVKIGDGEATGTSAQTVLVKPVSGKTSLFTLRAVDSYVTYYLRYNNGFTGTWRDGYAGQFEIYQVTYNGAKWEATFALQNNLYSEQILPVLPAATAISEEPEIPADNGGETGNNT